ncbi:KH domain-containing protein [Gloeocapsopsis crepidinum LEGE 06123]|uniref:KH domain-containing protein n=1 Tax=Gloeocapsopsis crepidinum LEGE 06123 TaxID=588587 RepID=A0ABR9UVF6_9CHRO|nr:KH domain-containing protein [Gloeocapsopsis crepidinum LEGE 06123]
MSLNSSVPQQTSRISYSQVSTPDYTKLVKFLIQPFLENPDSLSVDCEVSQSNRKVWVRVAFESEDKGKIYGRGGRNIQAIRTVIAAAGAIAEQSVYLDIYGGDAQERDLTADTSAEIGTKPSQQKRRTTSKPNVRLRSRSSVQ